MGKQPMIVWTGDDLVAATAELMVKFFAVGQSYMAYQAGRIEGNMKTDAPWTDRTGNARQGLYARSGGGQAGANLYIDLGHSVPYGLWLEVRHSGRYAIVMPTLKREAPEVLNGLANLMERL